MKILIKNLLIYLKSKLNILNIILILFTNLFRYKIQYSDKISVDNIYDENYINDNNNKSEDSDNNLLFKIKDHDKINKTEYEIYLEEPISYKKVSFSKILTII